jgi:hypothetical protein
MPRAFLLTSAKALSKAVHGDDAFAFPLERGENGRLTDLCRERLTLSLRGFLSQKGGRGRSAFCAIGARGVSMRRLSLPASSEEELQRVLRLQIESEFPLSPDELAWGSRPIGRPKRRRQRRSGAAGIAGGGREKGSAGGIRRVLAACGVVPIFTLAALARAELHPPPSGSCAVLDIGRTHSELMTFDNGSAGLHSHSGLGRRSHHPLDPGKLGVSHDEAEKLKMTLDQPGTALARKASCCKRHGIRAGRAGREPQTRSLWAKTLFDRKKRA